MIRSRGASKRSSPYGRGWCITHNKQRSMNALVATKGGNHKCMDESECIISEKEGESDKGWCSVHHKQRSMDTLVVKGGRHRCSPDEECMESGSGSRSYENDDPETGYCVVHHKTRSLDMLVGAGKGKLKCAQGEQCKASATGSSRGGGRRQQNYDSADQGLCGTHQKMRSMDMLVQKGRNLRCAQGEECQVSTQDHYDGEEEERAECVVHNKQRSLSVLVETNNGNYKCASGEECRAAGSSGGGGHALDEDEGPQMCSVHDKMRSASCLWSDGSGNARCTSSNRCK